MPGRITQPWALLYTNLLSSSASLAAFFCFFCSRSALAASFCAYVAASVSRRWAFCCTMVCSDIEPDRLSMRVHTGQ
ncbi:hypothetical protein T492DRAFT_1095472 [Pavlovales sp. CCMP2436]|nr:hypothetical protein T492DRAFT_1095472 [Pavlovales sp. CCMP2436]